MHFHTVYLRSHLFKEMQISLGWGWATLQKNRHSASELDQESKIRTKVKYWQCHHWRRFKLAWGTLSVFHSQTGINLGIFHKCRHWGLSNLSLSKYYSKTDQNKMALLCKSGKGRQEIRTPGHGLVYTSALCCNTELETWNFSQKLKATHRWREHPKR